MPNRVHSLALTTFLNDAPKPSSVLLPTYHPAFLPFCYHGILPLHAQYFAAAERVAEYAKMADDWDGEGASKISSEAVSRTQHALNVFSWQLPSPDIAPNPNGTFSLEWETPAGTANIEIGRTRYSGYIAIPGAPTRYFSESNKDIQFSLAAIMAALLFQSLQLPAAVTPIEMRNVR